MQTIKVTTTTKGNETVFAIDTFTIGKVCPDAKHPGRYQGNYKNFDTISNARYADAVEYIGNAIEEYFRVNLGLNVEFV